MSITKVSTAFLLVIGIIGYATSSAVALPLITTVVQNGAALDPAPAVVSSASSPGPGGTSGALGNEAFWFSDRSHEITNARTDAAGLLTTNASGNLRAFPYYLNGLEYIQLSNDNREDTDFSLNVTLSAPVTAFLFVDNRNNGALLNNPNTNDPVLQGGPLQWVIDDGWARVNSGFMPNGRSDSVGSDEGGTPAAPNENDPGSRVHTLGGNVAGPGEGLNQFYAIYRKNFPAGLHNGFTKANGVPGGTIYTVAVAPTMGAIIPADVNLSGVTDMADYNIIKTNFNQSGRTRAQGDLSGDGLVDTRDFRLWKTYAPPGVGSEVELLAGLGIPEPGSVVLAMLATISLAGTVARRGRR